MYKFLYKNRGVTDDKPTDLSGGRERHIFYSDRISGRYADALFRYQIHIPLRPHENDFRRQDKEGDVYNLRELHTGIFRRRNSAVRRRIG